MSFRGRSVSHFAFLSGEEVDIHDDTEHADPRAAAIEPLKPAQRASLAELDVRFASLQH